MGKDRFHSATTAKAKTFGIKLDGFTLDVAEAAVYAYRKLHNKVKDLWDLCGDAAWKAITHPGMVYPAGSFLKFRCVTLTPAKIPYLMMTLPSGRSLVYPYPMIEKIKDRECITFWGQLPNSSKWGRIKIWGGTFVENATQAVAADLMGNGAVTAEKHGYNIYALIHDQALAPVQPKQSVEEFTKHLVNLPAWAAGLPLKAETKITPYYIK